MKFLDESSKDTVLSKANNSDIWHANNFCDYLTLNASSLGFTINSTLKNIGKWQNLKQEKILKYWREVVLSSINDFSSINEMISEPHYSIILSTEI